MENGPLMRLIVKKVGLGGREKGLAGIAFEVVYPLV